MNYAIILAGGIGVRFNSTNIPKQFVKLTGIPMVVYSMKTAEKNPNIDKICVVAPRDAHSQIREWAKQYNIRKLEFLSISGKERHQSVYNGIQHLPAKKNDTVMIMTSVCPFLSQQTIDKHYSLIKEYSGVITVVKATDAITFSNDGICASRTLQKNRMFIQQGPQTYRYGIIKEAHEMYNADSNRTEVTEDSELVLNLGIDIGMVIGDRFCIKITYPEDLAIAESLHELFITQENSRM